MDKTLVIIVVVILIIIIGFISYNQYTVYKNNERLLKVVKQSEAMSDGYMESYEAIKAQYEKIESYYEKEIAIYKAISDRDDKVIEMLENKLQDEEERYQNLLKKYNQAVGNDVD